MRRATERLASGVLFADQFQFGWRAFGLPIDRFGANRHRVGLALAGAVFDLPGRHSEVLVHSFLGLFSLKLGNNCGCGHASLLSRGWS